MLTCLVAGVIIRAPIVELGEQSETFKAVYEKQYVAQKTHRLIFLLICLVAEVEFGAPFDELDEQWEQYKAVYNKQYGAQKTHR